MFVSFRTKLKALAFGLAAGLGAWIALALLLNITLFKNFIDLIDDFAYDHFLALISHHSPPEELVIIDLNTPSELFSRVDRKKCAALISALRQARAQTIGFDILFQDRADAAEHDSLLVSASEITPHLIHAIDFTAGQATDPLSNVYLSRHAIHSPIKPEFGACLPASAVRPPFAGLFMTDSVAFAHINFDADDTRSFPLVLGYNNEIYASLSLEMVRDFFRLSEEQLEIHFGAHVCGETHADTFVKLALPDSSALRLPVDQKGRLRINFISKGKFNGRYDIDEALARLHLPGDTTFTRRMVLVVNSGASYDAGINPLGEEEPNWTIHASVLSQILNKEHLTASPVGTLSFSFLFLSIVLLGLIFFETRFLHAKYSTRLMLVLICTLLVAGVIVKLYSGEWIGVVLPGVAISVGYVSAKLWMRRSQPRPEESLRYADFELLVEKKSGFEYLVNVLSSPAGEEARGEFVLRVSDLEELLQKLRSFTITKAELKTLGNIFFERLFPEHVQMRYRESLGRVAHSALERLRVKLRLEPLELLVLPWEFLYDPINEEYCALSEKISITRFLILPHTIKPLEVQPPLKILMVIPNPLGVAPLESKTEKRRIVSALERLSQNKMVELDILERATPASLRAALQKSEYHILHYIGHGDLEDRGEGVLILEDESGSESRIAADRLALLLKPTSIRLVVLNGCETGASSRPDYFLGIAPKLIHAGIPAVIAMQQNIPDAGAVAFSEAFYTALARSYQVDAALASARQALAQNPPYEHVTWGIPILFMRASDGVLFQQRREG